MSVKTKNKTKTVKLFYHYSVYRVIVIPFYKVKRDDEDKKIQNLSPSNLSSFKIMMDILIFIPR